MKTLSTIKQKIFDMGLFIAAFVTTATAYAQIYSGGGIEEGVTQAGAIVGNTNLRYKVISIVQVILSYMALIAVVVIVIAGIRLVISQGEDEAKEKAKKTIIYTIAGLILILLAKGIVTIFVNLSNV
jgi:hypothetical protein